MGAVAAVDDQVVERAGSLDQLRSHSHVVDITGRQARNISSLAMPWEEQTCSPRSSLAREPTIHLNVMANDYCGAPQVTAYSDCWTVSRTAAAPAKAIHKQVEYE